MGSASTKATPPPTPTPPAALQDTTASSCALWHTLDGGVLQLIAERVGAVGTLRMCCVCSRWRRLVQQSAVFEHSLGMLVPGFLVARAATPNLAPLLLASALMSLSLDALDLNVRAFDYGARDDVAFCDRHALWFSATLGSEHLIVGSEATLTEPPVEVPDQAGYHGRLCRVLLRGRFVVWAEHGSNYNNYRTRFYDAERRTWCDLVFPSHTYGQWQSFGDDDVIFSGTKNGVIFRQVLFDDLNVPCAITDRNDLSAFGSVPHGLDYRACVPVAPGSLQMGQSLIHRVAGGIKFVSVKFSFPSSQSRGASFGSVALAFGISDQGLLEVVDVATGTCLKKIKTDVVHAVSPVACGCLCFVFSCETGKSSTAVIVDWVQGKVLKQTKEIPGVCSGVLRPDNNDSVLLWILTDARNVSPRFLPIQIVK